MLLFLDVWGGDGAGPSLEAAVTGSEARSHRALLSTEHVRENVYAPSAPSYRAFEGRSLFITPRQGQG